MKLSQLHEDSPPDYLLEYAGVEGHMVGSNKPALQTTGLGSEKARQTGEIEGGDQLSLDRTPHDRALKGDVTKNLPGEKGETQKKIKIRKLSGGGERDPEVDDPTSWTGEVNPRGPLSARREGGRGKQSKPWTPTV
jgi:hypothetical protein